MLKAQEQEFKIYLMRIILSLILFLIIWVVFGSNYSNNILKKGEDLNNFKLGDNDCAIESASQITDLGKYPNRTIGVKFMDSSSNDTLKVFEIYNTSDSIYYLYTGLLFPVWYHQPYLHQIDKRNKDYYLSFAPTYGYIKLVYSYKNVALHTHHNWYRFLKLNPGEFCRFRIELGKDYFNNQKNSISYFEPHNFEKTTSSKMLDKRSIKEYNNYYFQIAVYRNIQGLCEPQTKTSEKNNFFELQKDFFVLKTPFNGW